MSLYLQDFVAEEFEQALLALAALAVKAFACALLIDGIEGTLLCSF
ncbi:MAG: hypothetical protein FWD58_01475 [Firmicutes bacterium]|nr:hypothetical protein [Bacillota bacterium]